jgi:hypothetical protein
MTVSWNIWRYQETYDGIMKHMTVSRNIWRYHGTYDGIKKKMVNGGRLAKLGAYFRLLVKRCHLHIFFYLTLNLCVFRKQSAFPDKFYCHILKDVSLATGKYRFYVFPHNTAEEHSTHFNENLYSTYNSQEHLKAKFYAKGNALTFIGYLIQHSRAL